MAVMPMCLPDFDDTDTIVNDRLTGIRRLASETAESTTTCSKMMIDELSIDPNKKFWMKALSKRKPMPLACTTDGTPCALALKEHLWIVALFGLAMVRRLICGLHGLSLSFNDGVRAAFGDQGDMDHCCAQQLQYKFAYLMEQRPTKYLLLRQLEFDENIGKILRRIDTVSSYDVANCQFLISKWAKSQKFATIMHETLKSSDVCWNIWRQVAVWMLAPLLCCHVLIMLAYTEEFLEPEFSWFENYDEEYGMLLGFRTPYSLFSARCIAYCVCETCTHESS